MAVTTGTLWDIVLNGATVVDPSARTVSPRTAYQAALYRRAVLLDLRSDARRTLDGALAQDLDPVVVDPPELGRWLRESLAVRVHLIADDGVAPAVLAAAGDARLAAIEGGYPAWVAAGLPTQ